MVFSSLTFLYGFLPVTVLLYFVLPGRKLRNGLLLAASLLFYAWGEPKHIFLMLAASVAAYAGGLTMDAARQRGKKKLQTAAFLVTLGLLIGNLLVFKYCNFFTENLAWLGVKKTSLALPIGISFYTFQILSYVIDLQRGKIPVQRNFLDLTLYVSFFPQLIAGPIVRYETVAQELQTRQESWPDAVAGTKRFILGLSKKVLLANNVALVAKTIYETDAAILGMSAYWLAAAAYALQIYFDFSGYSDMAIGLGRIFGFHFLENFDYPYAACSVTEFWRRWHISLSSWFRDYVYIPLGGNRVSRARWVRNILVVWALTGFWHGASWNFILWGLYYGLLLLLEKAAKPVLEKLPTFLRRICTLALVCIGWVIFNLTELSQMLAALAGMFCFRRTDWLCIVSADGSFLMGILYCVVAAVCAFPVLGRKIKSGLLQALVYLALLGVCILSVISSSYNPFIYFRF